MAPRVIDQYLAPLSDDDHEEGQRTTTPAAIDVQVDETTNPLRLPSPGDARLPQFISALELMSAEQLEIDEADDDDEMFACDCADEDECTCFRVECDCDDDDEECRCEEFVNELLALYLFVNMFNIDSPEKLREIIGERGDGA